MLRITDSSPCKTPSLSWYAHKFLLAQAERDGPLQKALRVLTAMLDLALLAYDAAG